MSVALSFGSGRINLAWAHNKMCIAYTDGQEILHEHYEIPVFVRQLYKVV